MKRFFLVTCVLLSVCSLTSCTLSFEGKDVKFQSEPKTKFGLTSLLLGNPEKPFAKIPLSKPKPDTSY